MFAGLIAGFKSIRTNLLNGYSLIFLAWLLWPKLINVERPFCSGIDTCSIIAGLGESDFAQRLNSLFDALGDGAELGALTFGAIVLGSVVERLGLNRVLDQAKRFGAPDWEKWVKSKLDDVKRYGENPAGHLDLLNEEAVHRTTPTSNFYEQYLWEEYQAALRDQSEARFRHNLFLISFVVGIAVFFLDPAWRWVIVSTWLALAFEISVRWRLTSKGLTRSRMDELRRSIDADLMALSDVSNSVSELESRIEEKTLELSQQVMEEEAAIIGDELMTYHARLNETKEARSSLRQHLNIRNAQHKWIKDGIKKSAKQFAQEIEHERRQDLPFWKRPKGKEELDLRDDGSITVDLLSGTQVLIDLSDDGNVSYKAHVHEVPAATDDPSSSTD